MQWFKGASSFIVGSDRWMGSQNASPQQGMPSPSPPETIVKSSSMNSTRDPEDPPAAKYDPGTGLRVRSPTRSDSLDQAAPSYSKLYPDVYSAQNETPGLAGKPVEASEEVLLKIPGSLVHLVDDEESVPLASGDFLLVKLLQNGTGVALFARVGDEIQWPVVNDMPATKLDPSHYVFSLKLEDDDEEKPNDSKGREERLNYGVTFKLDGNTKLLQELDNLLKQHSYFSTPTILRASEEDLKKLGETSREVATKDSELPIRGKPVSTEALTEQKPSTEVSTAFWTTIAPNVDDYNSSLARAIASGTGHIIRGILWCSDTTASNLEKSGKFIKSHSMSCKKPSEISPRTMRNIRRVKRVTKMSESVAKGVLSGVVSVTSFFTSSVVSSKAGKKFFKLLPGEVALASLDGFGKIFDAIEVAGSKVMNTSSTVTTGAISHRFGDQAAEFAHEGLASAGHLFTAAWTISKLRNAINPRNAMKPTSVLRTAAKAASQEMKLNKK